ncbi:MAG TPA: Imm49 family immunity protein [Myxococcaceae bacterium]|nr:Imm49 family immunity protein [Myxococcaceae bacterium]
MSDLADLPEQFIGTIEMMVEAVNAQPASGPLDDMCNRISEAYRGLGICALLLGGDRDKFFHLLIHSALTRKLYLSKNGKEQRADPYRKASINGPFLDAVAAAQWPLAREIAALSPTRWWDGEEYEDDFAYSRALYLMVADRADAKALEAAIDQLERALEGQASPRLDVVRALRDRDAKAFEDAFDALLDDHKQAYQKSDKTSLALDASYLPNKRVMIEGLAILQLAESLELPTAREYRYCPKLARVPKYAPFESFGFPDIPLPK